MAADTANEDHLFDSKNSSQNSGRQTEVQTVSFPTGSYKDNDLQTQRQGSAGNSRSGSPSGGASQSDKTARVNRDTVMQAQAMQQDGAELRPRELLDLSDPSAPAWKVLEAESEEDRAKAQAEQSHRLAQRKAV